MEQHLGQRCSIEVKPQDVLLHFEGVISAISDTHISFVDKHGISKTFRVADVVEIGGINEKWDLRKRKKK